VSELTLPKKGTRARRIIWIGLGLVFLAIIVSFAVQASRRSIAEARTYTCRGRIQLLAQHTLELYLREHGTMPFSAHQPEIADPACLGVDKAAIAGCPVASRGGRMAHTGYRMFNWRLERWISAIERFGGRKWNRGDPGELPRGLPLVWCSEPAHSGQRNVAVIAPGPWSEPLKDGLPLIEYYLMAEADFQAMMYEVRRTLASGTTQSSEEPVPHLD